MKRRSGFTLIELVVVILILGILAGVAAPKLFNTSAKATDNSARTTLTIIRDAIELYTAENGGTLPVWSDSDTFHADLAPFLRGTTFPNCPVGTQAGTNVVVSNGSTTGADGAWRYDAGEFFINDASASTSGIGNLDTF